MGVICNDSYKGLYMVMSVVHAVGLGHGSYAARR